MTKEEIIDFCEMKSQLEPENEDIFNYIIKVLESCEDCVSRQAVIDGINEYFHDEYYQRTSIQDCMNCLIRDVIKDLPSVTPTTCIAKISFDKEAFQKIVDEKVQELVAHGTCKDCSIKRLDKEESEEVGAEKYFCPVVCGYVDETPDFYCEKFEKGGSEDGRD